MRHIYFSPHLDDAVLSCGGLIREQVLRGERVEIWTIFTGVPDGVDLSPLARDVHASQGTRTAAETLALRIAEDLAACARLGAAPRHFGLLDAIYRDRPDGSPVYTELFVPIDPAEAEFPARVTEAISGLLEPGDIVTGPLCMGGHVDHRVVRAALERIGLPLWFYADIPYLIRHPGDLAPTTAAMSPTRFDVSPPALQAWLEAIAAYATQMQPLFGGEAAMREAITAYWQADHGLQLWQVD
jgi:LmbE family N-acetylglucosaminyl deacetylase